MWRAAGLRGRGVMAAALCALFVLATAAAAPGASGAGDSSQTLNAREIETLLSNQRLLQNMIKCVLDEGPCTHQGKQIKKALPQQVATGCSDCSEERRQLTAMLFRKIKESSPDGWERLLLKYDPTAEYRHKYNWLDA